MARPKGTPVPNVPGLYRCVRKRPTPGTFYYAHFQEAKRTFDGWLERADGTFLLATNGTLREAKQLLAWKRQEYRTGGQYVHGRSHLDAELSVHQVLAREVVRQDRENPASAPQMAVCALRLEAYFGADTDTRTIERQQYAAYVVARRGTGRRGRPRTDASIYRDIEFFGRAINRAHVDLGLPRPALPIPPRSNYKRVAKHEGMSAKVRSNAEVAAMLSQLAEPWASIVQLILYTGIRRGELCRLKRSDLHLTASKPYAMLHRKTFKHDGFKKVPKALPRPAVALLQRVALQVRHDERLFGQVKLTSSNLNREMQRACGRANGADSSVLPDWERLPITPRDLRATYGRGIYELYGIEDVRVALGHKNIGRSQEYIDLQDAHAHDRNVEAVDRLAKVWEESGSKIEK